MPLHDKHSVLERLWGYVCLVPSGMTVAYAIHGRAPAELDELWLQLLSDLIDGRLRSEEARRRYQPFFKTPAEAASALGSLQTAWCQPGMDLLRGMMERDIRALQAQGLCVAVVPAETPPGRGDEAVPERGGE